MKDKVLRIVELAEEVKADDIVVLDLRKICNFCDYFVICTGTSSTHVKGIADQINARLKECGFTTNPRASYQESRWIVLDYASVMVHVFDQEAREFYDLENLWAQAKKMNLKKKEKKKK
ncbi:MAG: ribosome silencing factor [Candidatus Omnitrophota bacterium]